jgi:hypothetical protein
MLVLEPPEPELKIQTAQEKAKVVLSPSGKREERLSSVRLQRELTGQACRGLPTTYRLLLRSLEIAEGSEAGLLEKALQRLMEEDACAGRPLLVALAVSGRAGGRPAPWFFEKAQKLGRYTAAVIDDLELLSFTQTSYTARFPTIAACRLARTRATSWRAAESKENQRC